MAEIKGGILRYDKREKAFIGEVELQMNGGDKSLLFTLVLTPCKDNNRELFLKITKTNVFLVDESGLK